MPCRDKRCRKGTGVTDEDLPNDRPDWPLRPWLLAALGAVTGLIVHLILGDETASWSAAQLALTSGIAAAAVLIGFTLERQRAVWSLVFALVCGLVIALVLWWNGTPEDWNAGDGWRAVSVFLAVAIAAPLFQTARDAGRARFDYVEVHGHAWTNVVMWGVACAFVGATFLTAFLLAELFKLIGIEIIEDALQEEWFWRTLIGAAFGGAVGILRERDRIMRTLLTVLVAVLRVIAPVLGVGLVLFLLSLPFTGLAPLWEATKSTTPILLACVIAALVLVNAVIGNSDAEESRFPPLRWGAMALAAAMLPLGAIAAVSTGARIAQYGFTPDRLWALVFVIVACAYGLAYLVSLVLGRLRWAERVRPANLRLAFGTCALALFLALPILSFNALSANDQVARLSSGHTSLEKFDWAALRFDFGEAGTRALEQLRTGGAPDVRLAANRAALAKDRYVLGEQKRQEEAGQTFEQRVRILPSATPLPEPLRARLLEWQACGDGDPCVVIYRPGESEAIAVKQGCTKPGPGGRRVVQVDDFGGDCAPTVARLVLTGGGWVFAGKDTPDDTRKARNRVYGESFMRGEIDIRPVERRQVFVGGLPAGEAF